jgi:ribosomal protein L40E
VHMVPPMAEKGKEPSQYEQVINRLRYFDPRARILGVTATPYRLNWGYIYGDVKTQDPSRNWFPDLTYSIDIATLREQGYLCELEKWGHSAPDLSHVSISKANGDYKENELSAEMSREVHLESAVNAVREYASDRRHIVVFAVTIEHAELLSEKFRQSGYRSAFVHSKMPDSQVAATLAAFANGSVNVLVNVGKLTEGWDCPQTDCVVLCRPTKSAALYVQMVGRGLRIAEGKDKCLMLDLAGCLAEHGFPEAPEIKNKLPDKANWLECPECGKENLVDATECAKCGYLFAFVRCPQCGVENKVDAEKCKACGWVLPKAPVPVAEEEEKKEESQYACPYCGAMVKPTAIRCWKCQNSLQLISGNVTLQKIELDAHRLGRQRAKLVGTPNINFHFRSRKGNTMMRVTLACLIGDDDLPTPVSDYLDIEGNGSEYGKARARTKWHQLTGRPYVPSTLDAAESMRADLRFPEYVTVELKNGQYWNVASY